MKGLDRLQRLFGAAPSGGGAHESAGTRRGAPGDADRIAIARRLLAAAAEAGGGLTEAEAEGIATGIVREAELAIGQLEGFGAGVGSRGLAALEAVVQVRGRPAVKVVGDDLEDIRQYPESDMWKMLADQHFARMMKVVAATAALRVTDSLLPDLSWVQGTAFLVSDSLALTNRHVLFPRGEGARLARRHPGSTTARMKSGYDVQLDFAFDSGPARTVRYRIVDVPFVAEDANPVDAALLRVERIEGAAPAPLAVSDEAFDIDRLYLVGHPGTMNWIPEDVLAVFGTPDERKRVSFGMTMEAEENGRPSVIRHDASTIGGYSGAAVLGFATTDVQALHYWGDPVGGNEAIPATALRAEPQLGAML